MANTENDLMKAKENVYSLIDAGKYTEAKSAFDKLSTDFNGQNKLSDSQYWIGERYARADKFDEARSIYQQIMQNPNDSMADKARMGVSKADAMSFIMSEQYSQASEAIDKMVTGFAGNPDLPETFFWITERYIRIGKFEEAKRRYQQIMTNYPKSPYAEKSRLFYARCEATSLIASEKFDDAQTAIDRMFTDFAGNPDLPEVIYWTVACFEPVNRFEELKKNYQKLIDKSPSKFYAEQAKLGISQAEVIGLIRSGDYSGARSAINKMSADFAGNTGLPKALYWLTERYEFANKFDEAKTVYQQIIKNHPDSQFAGKAQLGIRRIAVMALMNSADGNKAQDALNKMVADFKDNPELPRAVFVVGAKCFFDAKTPDSGKRAMKTVQKVIEELPRTEPMAGMYKDVYCCAGDCSFDMNDNTQAMSYYKKVADDFPEHILSAKAQFRIGKIYERQAQAGQVTKPEAQNQIKLAYEQLLLNHPNSEYADSAKNWLNKNKSSTVGQP